MFLTVLSILFLAIWVYILFIRPKLIEWYPLFSKFTQWEQTLFDQSRTILQARFYWMGGILVALHELAAQAGIDWTTPITDELSNHIPERWRGIAIGLFMMVVGLGFAWLRKTTAGAPTNEEIPAKDLEKK